MSMSAKRFVITLVVFLCLFIAGNIALWHSGFRHIFLGENGHGSLGRMSGLYFPSPETTPMKYAAVHTEFRDYLGSGQTKTFDVLTIGDSFSNGYGGNYFQDYLVDCYHLSVLNVPCRQFSNPLAVLYLMDKVGYLDEVKPRILILESTVTGMPGRFGTIPLEIPVVSREGFNQSHQLTKAQQKIQNDIEDGQLAPSVMVRANFSILAKCWYRWTHPGNGKPNWETRMARLTKAVFTNPGMESTLVYAEGLQNTQYAEKVALDINTTINETTAFLAKKGIKLVLLPMVENYDLYFPYFENKDGCKEINLLSQLERLPRQYTLINTKTILRKVLEEESTKDLYWADENHFSWKAQQIVCDEIARQMNF